MNVLMLAEHIHPHIGGVEKHIAELNRALTGWGYKIVLWAPKYEDSVPDYEEYEGLKIHRVAKVNSKSKGSWNALAWWFRHLDLIRSADCVHFHGSYAFFHWFFPFRLIFPSKPMFITYHGCGMTVPPIKRERIRNRLTRPFMRGNIMIGHFLEKWHRLKPTFVSYGGVTIPSEVPSNRENTAVYVGRLDEDSGTELYIRALKELRDKFNIECPLTICGDGALKSELENYCSDIGLDVTFKGFVDNPMDYLLSARYAFVSGYLSILEAMAARCLVFAVYKNRIKEDYLKLMPDANTMMIIEGDPYRLAEHLKRSWENKSNFHGFIDRSFSFAQDQSWERLAKTYMKLWEAS